MLNLAIYVWVCVCGAMLVDSLSFNVKSFSSMAISSQVTLTKVSIAADNHALCSVVCFLENTGVCFAVQYVLGSFTCSLQLNCGFVSLVNDPTGNSVVYVPASLVGADVPISRPYLFFPLVKDCNGDYSVSYGVQTVSSPPAWFGTVSDTTNTNPVYRTTMWSPSSVWPATSYGFLSDSGSVLDIFRGSFTISFLFYSNAQYAPVLTFYTGDFNMCFSIRTILTTDVWIRYDPSCTCSPSTGTAGSISGQMIDNATNLMHLSIAFDAEKAIMNAFVNGAFQSSVSATFGFSDPVKLIHIGSANNCSVITQSSAIGTLACLLFNKYAVSQTEASSIFKQCNQGALFIS